MEKLLTLMLIMSLAIVPAAYEPETAFSGVATLPPLADPTSAPTPWTGDGHWYTFQVVTSGLVSSTGTHYVYLDGPFYLGTKDAVAIGKIKGQSSNVKVYTTDPEERLIWYKIDGSLAALIRTGFKLPDPSPEAGRVSLVTKDMEYVLANEADAEIFSLMRNVDAAGQPLKNPGALSDTVYYVVYFTYDDLPNLSRQLTYVLSVYETRLVLVSRSEDETTPFRMIDVPANSGLQVFADIQAT